ncbi:MAG: 1-acyl-sn-glycerol-3-phosphate acyltransferase [Candidatus Obscuribacterales bacterium]|nr:1-acyl-sn-glycerol-3-phosphate acyltransferase [Candidatus Obscuribacterales bacterium]
MLEFREPRPNALVESICKAILPFWLKFREHLRIQVKGSQNNLEDFSRKRRAVILLNHSDRQDPFAICMLAKQMHEVFYCIAARECFDWDGGWRGRLFQSLGCFSVMRGKADFHCIATTKKILREAKRKLIVFPEAEITADEEHLHDLQKAIFHIMLSVEEELAKNPSLSPDENVVIIPAAIKFSLDCDLHDAVLPTLKKLEKILSIRNSETRDALSRIHAIIDSYLDLVFKTYGIPEPEAPEAKLAEYAAVAILEKIAAKIGMKNNESISPMAKLYATRIFADGNSEINSVALAPKALHCSGIRKVSIQSDFERIERLLILERMLAHSSSDIQSCRMLDFIEGELCGAISPKGSQSCVLSLGAAIKISAYLSLYEESKEKGVDTLTEDFKKTLQDMMAS